MNSTVNRIKESECLSSDIRRMIQGIDFDKMQRMENFLDQLPFCAFIKDKEDRIIDCNAAFLELSGLTKKQMLGYGWKDYNVLSKTDLAHYLKNDLEVIETGKSKKIFEVMSADPTIKLLTYKIPFYQRGEIIGIIGFSIDITELLNRGANG